MLIVWLVMTWAKCEQKLLFLLNGIKLTDGCLLKVDNLFNYLLF